MSDVLAVLDEADEEKWVSMQEGAVMCPPSYSENVQRSLLKYHGIDPSSCEIKKRTIRTRIEVLT